MNNSRRSFLKRSAILASSPLVLPLHNRHDINPETSQTVKRIGIPGDKLLKGFIVSDAHFGWLSKSQPTPHEQARMMNIIMDRFPDLDVFIDTGDAHHDYAKDCARGDWTDVIQGGCRTVPFFFVVGNHENYNSLTSDDPYFDYDAEFKSNILGSVECQPYYSFEIKGIHFISLPQVMDQGYISDAEIAWLKMDLDIHRDKTTIILSHNSLKGTTEYFADPGYRLTTNSEVLLRLFKNYPNIVAWMHGHNHTYEVVPVAGTVYVSNGRIGGFDPSNRAVFNGNYGAGNLGGIYFELSKDYFEVRCYSATQDKFFDEIPDHQHLSHRLNRETSFNPIEPYAVGFGFGGSPHGQKLHAYHHHVGGQRKLFITGAESPVINENPLFKVYTQRTAPDWQTKHLSGYSFEPNEENSVKNDETWQWLNPGVRILRRDNLSESKAIFAPNATLSQRSYYRCAPGNKYRITADVRTQGRGQKAVLICRVYEKNYVMVCEIGGKVRNLKGGEQKLSWTFNIPSLEHIRTIYTDCSIDNDFMVTVGISFSNLSADVDIHSFRFMLSDAEKESVTISPAINVDDTQFSFSGILPAGTIQTFNITGTAPHKSCYLTEAKGNRRVTWIEKQIAPVYQVRNATAVYKNGTLTVGPLRNHFSPREEIVIVPMKRSEVPFVHRVRHVKWAAIEEASEGKKEIGITTGELWSHGFGEIEVVCTNKPRIIEGSNVYSYEDGYLTMKVERNSHYRISW